MIVSLYQINVQLKFDRQITPRLTPEGVLMTRLSVTYPDLPPPYPVNNQDTSSGENTEIDDPPPEYATLPPPSDVDHYSPTYIPPPEAPAMQPAENADTGVRTVRKRPARIKMVPKVIHVPQFVHTEDQTPVLVPGGNVTMEVREMSETTLSVINSIFEVGVAAISIVGALFALIFNWRQKRRVERAQKQEEPFPQWQQQEFIPADETFVPSGDIQRRVRKRVLSKRSHSRDWQFELLD